MTRQELPEAFVQRLERLLEPRDLADTLASFDHPPATAFRINTLKTTPDAVLDALPVEAEPLPWYDEGYLVNSVDREQLTHSQSAAEGEIYIQNPASMLAPLALNPQPEEEVLDLAAAPGGKTLMMAAMMEDRGRIAAVEPVRGRFFRLKRNLEAFGASIVETYLKDGREVGWKVPERFDRVLLDAPCSSEARFTTTDPESFHHWNEKKVKEVQRKQKKLIASAVAALKPGGTLVYSTCSFSPEENELVVQHALKKFAGQLRVEPIGLQLDNFRRGLTAWREKPLCSQLSQAVRVLPTEIMHGFFLCKLRKQ